MALHDPLQTPDPQRTTSPGDLNPESFSNLVRAELSKFKLEIESLKDAVFRASVTLSGGNLITHDRMMELCGLEGKPKWQTIDRIFRYLETPEVQPNIDRKELMNRVDPKYGRTLLHQLCIRGAPVELIEHALRLGADPNAQTRQGESAIYCVFRAPRNAPVKEIVDRLLEAGADPGLTTISGASFLSRALLRGDIGKLAALSPDNCTAVTGPAAIEQHRAALTACCKRCGRVPRMIDPLLMELVRFKEVLGADLLSEAMNREVPSPFGRNSILTLLCASGTASTSSVKTAISLGADPHRPVRFVTSDSDTHVLETAIHVAVASGNTSALQALLESGVKADTRDSKGLTPLLTLCAYGSSEKFRESVGILLVHGADIDARTNSGTGCAAFCIMSGKLKQLAILLEHGLTVEGADHKTLHELEAVLTPKPGMFFDRSREVDLARLVDAGASLEELTAYLKIWKSKWVSIPSQMLAGTVGRVRSLAHKRDPDEEKVDPAFTSLLPRLLFGFPPGTINGLITALGQTAEFSPFKAKPYNPYEAELVALLNHPADPHRVSAHLLSDVITAIPSWIRFGVKSSGEIVNNWADIGLLTFSFLRWKYDAQRLTYPMNGSELSVGFPSLMEQCGKFDRLSAVQDDKGRSFGSGFELREGAIRARWLTDSDGEREELPFDQKTRIIFFRGGLVASHPDHGTVIVRNSSTEFGRDLIPHPCMWSRVGIGRRSMTIEDLRNLTPEAVRESFRSFLDPSIYTAGEYNTRRDNQSHFSFLLSHIRAAIEDYSAWKFDTKKETAWMDTGLGILQSGGHLSPGFRAVVRYLEGCLEASRAPNAESSRIEVPDLAFIHPDLHPWGHFDFKLPSGETTRQMKVTPKVLEVLGRLCDGVATDQELAETGLRAFFQQAGFNKQGELILVKAER